MQATKVCVDTILQDDLDDDYRGRAFAIYDAGANTCSRWWQSSAPMRCPSADAAPRHWSA
jgi:hypothetical protein